MKQIIVFLLSICIALVSFSGCTQTPGTDGTDGTSADSGSGSDETPKTNVWDGSIAESFAGGDGSEADPFLIQTAAQLAFLAQEVNAGKDYTGKYISLACDLDLNDIEWTPIGNGTHSFDGIFNGNDHTISNLKITDGAKFVGDLSSAEMDQYAAGLFGTAWDAVIQNVKIDHANVVVQNVVVGQFITVGILVGDIRANTYAEISGVSISNASIRNDFPQVNAGELCIGGVCGYVCGKDDAIIKNSQIQSDVTISIENGMGDTNRVGGLIGTFHSNCNGNVENCSSDLSVEIHPELCYVYEGYFGAIGNIFSLDTFSVSNMFSKITVNKIYDLSHTFPAYSARVIAGFANFWPDNSTGEMKNVFGYVEQLDSETGERVTSMELINLYPGGIYNETNCQGCEQLPENHGLDESIWDVSDPANPRLK